ncbi:MAG: SpoIVB peptidase S55 domain-containing protein [Armatimonadota bacterium]|nr:SpoIVB peptidase S55 domain-containing protein [Armatimonadota bacterium]
MRLLWKLALVCLSGIALAQPELPDVRAMMRDVFPVARVKPGMRGYGLTVFKGTNIERFEVEVVGVLENANFGRPLVMIRMKGGPITERNAMVIAGMSGSPIFIEGKILGAIAYGFSFPREPVALVTPLEDMLTNIHPKAATQMADLRQPRIINQPVQIGGKRYAGVYIGHEQPSAPNVAWARPLMTPLMVSGLSGRAMKLLKERLEPYGLMPVVAPGGNTNRVVNTQFEPGAAVGAPLATGDIDLTAIGTLTYRKGDYVLAFGHPFIGLGKMEVPMTAAEIIDVFSSYARSFKLGNRAQTLGAMYYDGAFAIAGRMGQQARMMPIRMRVVNTETGIQREFRCEVMRHPFFVDLLMLIAAIEFVDRVHFGVGDATAAIRWRLATRPFGEIRFENRVATSDFIADAAISDLLTVLFILRDAPEQQVELESLEMEVVIQPGRGTALIESVQLDKSVYRPGERVEATVRVRPADGTPAQTYTLSMRLPADAFPGRYILQVSAPAGGIGTGFFAPFLFLLGEGGGTSTPDTAQRLREFLRRERNNQLVATLNLPFPTLSVEGTPLEQLPPLMRSVLQGQRLSRVQLTADRIKQVIDTPYVLQGVQTVTITVLPPEAGRGPFPTPFVQVGFGEDGAATHDDEAPHSPPTPEGIEFPAPEVHAEGGAPSALPMPEVPPEAAQAKRERPVSRAVRLWQPSGFEALRRGKLEGVALHADGTLRLGVAPTSEQRMPLEYVWSAALGNDGALFLGGGVRGQVVRLASEPTVVAAGLPGVFATALTYADDGTLYVGLSPEGAIARVREGKSEVVLRLEARYVNALAWRNGTLYIATGVPAMVLAWDGNALRPLLTSDEAHFCALAVGSDGVVYAGTSERGIVYRIMPTGASTPIADLREPSVIALATDAQGNLYIAGTPSGGLYRWTVESGLQPVQPPLRRSWRSLLRHENTLYALTENEVYMLNLAEAGSKPVLLFRKDSVQFVSASIGAGKLYLVSADGRVLTLNQHTEGIYLSPVLDAGAPARWGTIRWSATVPSNTEVIVQTRSGNTREPDATWSDWTTSYPNPEGSQILSPTAQYLQVRVILKGNAEFSPVVHQLSVSYLPANRPPEVQLVGIKPYAALSGKQVVRWRGRDPDGDTLRFEVQLSRDGGQTWQPLKDGKSSPSDKLPQGLPLPAPADGVQITKLDISEAVPPEVREQMRQQLQQMVQQGIQATQTSAPSTPSEPSAPEEAQPPTPAQNQQPWDTTQTPDGVYLVRVMATDQPASPTDYAVAYSPVVPVVVCNTPPVLLVNERNLRVDEKGVVELTGFVLQYFSEAARNSQTSAEQASEEGAPQSNNKRRMPQHSIPIVGVQYKVGNGEWLSAEPLDGVFDSAFEAFRVRTEALPAGAHTLTIKAFNAAGGSTETQQKVKVERKPSENRPQSDTSK